MGQAAIYLASGHGWPRFDSATWGTMLWIAVVSTAIARLLLFAGINKSGSRQAALISPLETLLGVLFAVAFYLMYVSFTKDPF